MVTWWGFSQVPPDVAATPGAVGASHGTSLLHRARSVPLTEQHCYIGRPRVAPTVGAFGFDSVTVNPYMGPDSLAPFLEWEDKGVWVLCRTSNAGAGAVQDLPVGTGAVEPLYERILRMLLDLPARADVGIVVGATSPAELARMRTIAPALPLLIPGLGTQGGEARTAVEAAETGPVVINSSRSILYGSDATVRERALRARDELNVYRRLPHAATDGHRPS